MHSLEEVVRRDIKRQKSSYECVGENPARQRSFKRVSMNSDDEKFLEECGRRMRAAAWEEYEAEPDLKRLISMIRERDAANKALVITNADVQYRQHTRISSLESAVKVLDEALEFYGEEENWMKPDQYVPYFTLWDNGDCIGWHKARTAREKAKELVK